MTNEPSSAPVAGRKPSLTVLQFLRSCLRDPAVFIQYASSLKLRNYQAGPCQAITNSVIYHRGLTFVVMFPRQSGKNELQAQIEAYLLTLYSQAGGEIVKVSPTYNPQTLNAMRRLERVLSKNLITQAAGWSKEEGYIYRIGSARIYFFSGHASSNIVGATASTLLEVDEAQDVDPAKYDKDVSPMAASTNATRVFWGTAWTSQTLLAREYRASKIAELQDSIQRTWRLTADEVGMEVDSYRQYVQDQVARMGRNHPLIKTQYFSEEIDAEGGMFPPARRALMAGTHMPRVTPEEGKTYAILIDVAGEEEDQVDVETAATTPASQKRDSTALTIVEIDLSTLADPLVARPTYLTRYRRLWTGVKHSKLYASIRAISDQWRPRWIVIDATGVGAGLASFLGSAYPERVIPFVFTSASKSQLGWDFIGVIESGRYKEHVDFDFADNCQARFWREVENVQMEVIPGPGRLIRWGMPNGTRIGGEYIHDDLVLSASLCALLDAQEWHLSGTSLVAPRPDPLKELDHGF